MELGIVVKERMTELEVKAPELAQMTGYTTRHIYDLLSGGARWNETSLERVCKALNMKIEVMPLEFTEAESQAG